jgi:protein phosphatase
MPVRQLKVAATRKPREDELDVFGLTHIGKVRKENQDHFLICSLQKHLRVYATSLPEAELQSPETDRLAFMAMVADGVGGGVGGEEASRFALRTVTEYVRHSMHCYYSADPDDDEDFSRELEAAALQVHEDLQEASEGAMRATTLSLLLGVWPRLYLLQVGDSRYYRWKDGRLDQISRDQTLAQDLIDSGVLKPNAPPPARLAHVLSSAIGGPTSRPEVTAVQNSWGSLHLLCSDGLTKHVPDARIAERLASMTSARQVCEALLSDALDAGGTDNITVFVGRTVKHGD